MWPNLRFFKGGAPLESHRLGTRGSHGFQSVVLKRVATLLIRGFEIRVCQFNP